MRTIGAVDIGGTKITVGAVSETGAILARLEQPTAPQQGFTAAIERTKTMLSEVCRQATADLCGIGVACTGPVDPFTGVLGDVGTLPGWQGGNLVAELEAEFGVATAVENDADAAALAEAGWGIGQGSDRFIYVTISTGIGAGIILFGRLYRGVEGSHPEIGHHVLDPSGPLCYCKARGCWESLASGPAMAEWARAQNPERGALTAEQICEMARQGDEVACRAVEREGDYIGLGLANLVTMFVPDTIALGGGLMKSADLFLDRARAVVRTISTQVPTEKTRIMPASLGADAGLIGAAQAWIHRHSGGGTHG